METTESRLQQECFMWHWNTNQNERGLLILMYNNPRSAIAGAMLKGMGLRKGMADLLYLRPTEHTSLVMPHFLECKLTKGVQSKSQKEFEQWCTQFGFKYSIFRSLEEFKSLI